MAPKWGKIKVLGAGSYGVVFLVKRESPYYQPTYAAAKSSFLERSYFSKLEGNFLRQLRDSPYIIRCFGEDLSVENSRQVHNLLLEYAQGGTLDGLIKSFNGRMPENLVALYSYMLLKGIACVHDRGILHCDIKPTNILVFPQADGLHHLKISDFGLARNITGDQQCDPRRATGNRGTLLYASPELVLCNVHETPADIWALGCTILQMFTGEEPWKYTDSEDLAEKIMKGKPEIPNTISHAGREFLELCLERDFTKRRSAKELLNHLFIRTYATEISLLIQLRGEEFTSNPFGYSSWISSKGMFSTVATPCAEIQRQKPRQETQRQNNRLVGDNDGRAIRRPFPKRQNQLAENGDRRVIRRPVSAMINQVHTV